MREIISRLISGEEIEVRTNRFENDFETFRRKDDVLTLLIHPGYLTWNEEDGTARIPNEEVRIEFEKILEGTRVSKKWMELIGRSQNLLEDTLRVMRCCCQGNSSDTRHTVCACALQ